MPPKRVNSKTNYYPSEEKRIVRDNFDLPLIESVVRFKNRKLRYFGMPGVKALDLRCWRDHIAYIAAVEFDEDSFRQIKHNLNTQFKDIDYRVHFGDVDQIILQNRSHNPRNTFVSTKYHKDRGYFWDFDVVYLDYFGKFLPYNRGGQSVRNRANAIRQLFSPERQDGWQPWLFMLTVESKLYSKKDQEQMRQFLSSAKESADEDVICNIDFLLDDDVNEWERAARLVGGTLSYIVAIAAANADVRVTSRPTVLYKGAHDQPMLHFAFEIKRSSLLSGSTSVLPLLRSPLMKVRDDGCEPWFELLAAQPPGQSDMNLRATLDFLRADHIDEIVSGSN